MEEIETAITLFCKPRVFDLSEIGELREDLERIPSCRKSVGESLRKFDYRRLGLKADIFT